MLRHDVGKVDRQDVGNGYPVGVSTGSSDSADVFSGEVGGESFFNSDKIVFKTARVLPVITPGEEIELPISELKRLQKLGFIVDADRLASDATAAKLPPSATERRLTMPQVKNTTLDAAEGLLI